MSFEDIGVKFKKAGGILIASIRTNVENRQQLAGFIEELKSNIPPSLITGPPFWIRNFIHSYPQGFDIEVGIPVQEAIASSRFHTRKLPEFAVLAKTDHGETGQLSETYQEIFACQDTYGLISDEFCIEVLHDHDPMSGTIEVQMVLHPWQELFDQHLSRVMGEEFRQDILDGEEIFVDSSVNQRFTWTKEAIDRFDNVSVDDQRYEVLSGCSHVYPREQAEKLHEVYENAFLQHKDMCKAVDAVLDFMEHDPGWRQKIYREGKVVYTTKNPRNPEAYSQAKTDQERRQAYCFCPIIRANIEEGMSPTFCYCSAGFERKQWEVALGQPVKIDIVKSLLKGDQQCQFAIHLPMV